MFYTLLKNISEDRLSVFLNYIGAWETTDLSRYQDDSVVSTRVVLSHPMSSEELPGSVPDLREEVQWRRPCNIHNTLLDQGKDRGELSVPVTSQNLKNLIFALHLN